MIPTRRLERLVLVLLLCSTACVWVESLRLALLLIDLGLVAACAFDFLRTPSPARLGVERSLPTRVGLSTDFTRRVRVDSSALPRAAGLGLELFEAFPPSFEVRERSLDGAPAAPLAGDPSGGPDRGRLARGAPLELTRVYRGTRRGVHSLGDMRLRLRGPLGLLERQARLAGSSALAIEPALENLSRTLALAASDRWRDLGVRRLRRRGGLTEFESLRDYVEGDDVRLVDWKAFARRGRPAVREYQEERGQEVLFLIDCGRPMGATTALGKERGWTKLDHALDTVLTLAAVALGKGDRVGACAFGASVSTWVAPARGARQFVRLTDALFDLRASSQESDLARALREVAVRHRRRALVIVLSDVADPLSVERQRQALSSGVKRHRVLFAGLDDPSLRRAAAGTDGAPVSVRAAALELERERRAGLAELARSGARVLDALPAEAAAPLLAAWLDARRAGA